LSSETADAIVVGARPAGCATAIGLARAGRRVVALDMARFPSDTLSTHLLFAGSVAELQRLEALHRVRALGAPGMPVAEMTACGMTVRGGYTPVDGIDHALCVRRPGLDAALVDTAREAGADVRERCRVTELLWNGDRVAGVAYEDADKRRRELRAPLVVGADGRRSTVARLAGAGVKRSNPNGRACYFAYLEDDRDDLRHVAAQWRDGAELGTAFPCNDGLVLCLLMPPVDRAPDFRGALEPEWDRTAAAIEGLGERLAGCRRVTKVRSAIDTTSYFKQAAGRGWALPGDSGHFKDPVTAQGIRDALHYGRRLGEDAAPVLDDPAALDAALQRWARLRERECREVYAWTNQLARAEPVSAIELELYREAAANPALANGMLDVFSRTKRPNQVLTVRRGARLTLRALRRPGADRPAILAEAARRARERR
jgi:2-polyprenyl-6-methoxyphenol hydroxylase-like FAD-dependent oxidoreductase